MTLTDRVRLLIRAQGDIPVCIETALTDIAATLDEHMRECHESHPLPPIPLGRIAELAEDRARVVQR